jgi:hypothetical protein
MAKLKFLSAPEIHVNDEYSLAVDVDVVTDDDQPLPGFHATVIVPLAQLAELQAQDGIDAAKLYIAQQIGVVDPRYTPERIAQAVMALTMQQTLTAYVAEWPFEVTIPTEG